MRRAVTREDERPNAIALRIGHNSYRQRFLYAHALADQSNRRTDLENYAAPVEQKQDRV
jgi:hypothetical protein